MPRSTKPDFIRLTNPQNYTYNLSSFWGQARILAYGELQWGFACKEKAEREAKLYFPTNDKQQHCYASCAFNRCMGLMQINVAFLGGVVHEILMPNYGLRDALRDIRADVYGIVQSFSFASCKDACTDCRE